MVEKLSKKSRIIRGLYNLGLIIALSSCSRHGADNNGAYTEGLLTHQRYYEEPGHIWMMSQGGRTYNCNNFGGMVQCN